MCLQGFRPVRLKPLRPRDRRVSGPERVRGRWTDDSGPSLHAHVPPASPARPTPDAPAHPTTTPTPCARLRDTEVHPVVNQSLETVVQSPVRPVRVVHQRTRQVHQGLPMFDRSPSRPSPSRRTPWDRGF